MPCGRWLRHQRTERERHSNRTSFGKYEIVCGEKERDLCVTKFSP